MISESPLPSDEPDTATPEAGRKATWYLLGAFALLLVPVVVGFVMANTDSSDTSNSGMDDMSGGVTVDGGSDGSVAVRDFLDVLDGGIIVDADPSGTSVTLRLQTKIDLACSVVYGRTTQFGSIATDLDMAGGGHSNHNPLLVDLTPGATYVYRLQGTDARGNVYVSEPGQFTTPGGDGSATPTNLSLDATVIETSSDFSESFAGANAIDGSLATEWSSRSDGNDAYIVIDLGGTADITGIGFRTREMSDGTSITNQFTVSVDGTEYGPFDAGIGMSFAEFSATGQTVRVSLVDTTGGNTGAVEIEIYGSLQ